ncbi:MAG: hypothetical protein ACMUJM_01505, partial [bacterium]
MLDWRFPFLRPLIPIFLIWLFIRIIFWIIGKICCQSIPLSSFKHPWLSPIIFIALAVLFIIVSANGMGSVLLPFLIVVIPSWSLAIYRSQKSIYSIPDKKTLQNLFLYLQWSIVAIIFIITIYSIVTFNSTRRLVKKLWHNSLSDPAIERLIKKGKEITSEITPLIEKFNEKNLDSVTYINLLKVVREIHDPSIAPLVAKTFQNMQYIDKIYVDELFIESGKTLTILDKKIASKIIIQKFKELKDSNIKPHHYEKIVDGLLKSIAKIDNNTLILAYKTLGAPDHGSDIEAYEEWWYIFG